MSTSARRRSKSRWDPLAINRQQQAILFLRLMMGGMCLYMAVLQFTDLHFPESFHQALDQAVSVLPFGYYRQFFSQYILGMSDVFSFALTIVQFLLGTSLVLGLFLRPMLLVGILLFANYCWVYRIDNLVWSALGLSWLCMLFAILWAGGEAFYSLDLWIASLKNRKKTKVRKQVEKIKKTLSRTSKKRSAKKVLGLYEDEEDPEELMEDEDLDDEELLDEADAYDEDEDDEEEEEIIRPRRRLVKVSDSTRPRNRSRRKANW